MAPEAEIRAIELRRLAELEKQQALHGPQTEPAVLIEIQDLRNKYGAPQPTAYTAPRKTSQALDYDFLMNTMAAALQRLTVIEQLVLSDQAKRPKHQAINMAWMIIITMLLLYTLFGR